MHMASLEDKYAQVFLDKVRLAATEPVRKLTFRKVNLPPLLGKAVAVIGMRRAGKTSYLHQLRAERHAAGARLEQLIYFNFEDHRLSGLEVSGMQGLIDAHERLYPRAPGEVTTLFLDEIQVVPGWESFVRTLLDTPGYEIFLSGSSAKLLSQEIATAMRGRAWDVPMQPFSFAEYLDHHGHGALAEQTALTSTERHHLDHHFAAYMETGGLPEVQGLERNNRRLLVQNYMDVALLRDVIERHGVSNVVALRWLMKRLLGNPASLFSISKFFKDLKSQGIAVSREDLYEFLDHFEDAFLLSLVPIASDSLKRRQVNPRKVYPTDPALAEVFNTTVSARLGQSLETLVHVELKRRRADISYVKTTKGHEVDFLARYIDGSHDLIQVCADLSPDGTFERELRSLVEAYELHPGARRLVLTADTTAPPLELPEGITHMAAWEWMMEARD